MNTKLLTTPPEESKPATLVGLSSEYQRTVDELLQLQDQEGEFDSKEHQLVIERITTALCEKVDAYGVVEAKLESIAEFWKAQKAACAQTQKVCENARESLRARMKYVLGAHPEKSLQGSLFRFFLAKSQPALELDELKLTPEWKKAVTTLVPDKERIKAALLEGKVVPGATLRETQTLRTGRPKL